MSKLLFGVNESCERVDLASHRRRFCFRHPLAEGLPVAVTESQPTAQRNASCPPNRPRLR